MMPVFHSIMDVAMIPAAWCLERNHKSLLGVRKTNELGRAYHSLRFGKQLDRRKQLYREQFSELIRENGEITGPVNEMKDGWCIDTSGCLPHLQRLLQETGEIIERQGGRKRETRGRPFLQNIIPPPRELDDALRQYRSIVDFATSSEMLTTLANYFGFVPTWPRVLPLGVRLMESDARFDETPQTLRNSQFFHLDYHDLPMVYVIVTLKDVTEKSGPFCFLPASVSDRVEAALDYRSKGGIHHRVLDDTMYSLVERKELIKLVYPAGTVLFIDSTRCFHYGSRNPVVPRYHLQYAYLTPCRTDFKDLIMRPYRFPYEASDSRLRKMVLDRAFAG